ncbi:MAG: GNAT family N-acetyltransferase [Candidatus Thermoplasmatota archaeon]|nr:GNAT family N-acetyltransferase [Candidatus Thermoplasmatota archaeon]
MVRIPFVADDGTQVTFREPRADDARQLMRFINSVIDEDMSGIVMDKRVTLKAEKAWLDDIIRMIRRRDAVDLLVECEGEILGNCDAARRRMKHSHRAAIGIALVKKARGKGIGEGLMRATIDLAIRRIKGIEFLDLSTFEYNRRAQRLYRNLGFAKVGNIPKAVREGDFLYSEHLMVLDLKNWRR